MKYPYEIRRQQGVTLLEIILSVALLGIVTVFMAPSMKTFLAVKDQSYQQSQGAINQKIANAMLNYAAQNTGVATPYEPAKGLPYPASDTPSKIFSGVAASTSPLIPFLSQQGISTSLFNDDGTSAQRVRTYQLAQSVTQSNYPLFANGGPLVNLTYDFGVIYTTDCPRSGTCNATSPPKTSAGVAHTAMTTLNFNTWTPNSVDQGVVFVSTLPMHKKLLAQFADQIDRFRTAVKNYSSNFAGGSCPFAYLTSGKTVCSNSDINTLSNTQANCRRRQAYPTAKSNPFPLCTGDATSADFFLPSPSVNWPNTQTTKNNNMGCWDGWYGLDSAGSPVLQAIGLTRDEFGFTPWGGTIEYCADYDPATSGATSDTAPHYAAIRFNKNVTLGAAAGSTSNAANVVIISW